MAAQLGGGDLEGVSNPSARSARSGAVDPSCAQLNDRGTTMERVEDTDATEAERAVLYSFLEGFGLGPDQRALMERLLAGARTDRHDDLGACVLAHAEQQFEAWLSSVLGPDIPAGQPALAIGRAAFLACGGPTEWTHLILLREDLPEAFVAAMRAAAPVLAPMPTPGTMAEQPLESWSIVDAMRGLEEMLGVSLGRWASTRPLPVTIKQIKQTS
jgi:hypothetical protein